MKNKRVIAHIDIDAFFASVEQRRRPWLMGRPVAVGGDPSRRGVVASASYEARRYGVRAAMPVGRVKRLCPACVVLPADFAEYGHISSRFFRLLSGFSPRVEPLSLEEAYFDLGGCRLLHGHPLRTAELIRGEILRALGLTSSIGIAASRTAAKIASALAKPGGILYVLPGRDADFLSPLFVRRIPGVGPRTAGELSRGGARTIGDLAVIGEELLVSAFGKSGSRLYAVARGEGGDAAPSRGDARSVSREVTFPEDVLSRGKIKATLLLLTERCCRALRREGAQAGTATVILRYADFVTVTRSARLPEPTDLAPEVFPAADALLRRAWTRRLRIRLVGLRLSRLTGSQWQESLFDGEKRAKLKRLFAGCDRIRERYGEETIMSGRTVYRM